MSTTIGAVTVNHFRPPPPLQEKSAQVFRVPGVAGSGAIVNDATGKSFEAQTTAYVAAASVESTRLGYRSLIGTVVDINYEGTSHHTAYATKYLVLDVQVSEAKKINRAIGVSFDHNPAGVITAKWTLVPIPS